MQVDIINGCSGTLYHNVYHVTLEKLDTDSFIYTVSEITDKLLSESVIYKYSNPVSFKAYKIDSNVYVTITI